VEAAGEYRKMLADIESDGLPRFEARFKALLNENTIREVAGFQSQLRRRCGGTYPRMFADVVPTLQLIAEGKVRALAVSSGAPIAVTPQIPPLAEAGVPASMRLDHDCGRSQDAARDSDQVSRHARPMLTEAEVPSWIIGNGLIPSPMVSADELPQFLALEIARWRRDLERIGLVGSQ
jgi:tripartite-type tricarboxylate transporter receptor subunit TctC